MTKRFIASTAAFALLLATSLVMLFAVVPQGQASALPDMKAAATSSDYYDVEDDGDSFNQGLGTTFTYDIDELTYDWSGNVNISTGGAGAVSCASVCSDGLLEVTATQRGAVTVTCTQTGVEQPKSRSFTINVLELNNTSGEVTQYVTGNSSSSYYTYYSSTFTFDISDLPANDRDIDWVSDSNANGSSRIDEVTAGRVSLYVYGSGTHVIQLEAYGKTITCVASLRVLGLKKTAAVKNTGSLMTYPGQKNTLKVAVTGVSDPPVSWSSSNSKIATVSKKGVVKAKKKGRCYAKAKVGDATLNVLVEVTSKKAYKAVNNGFKDMKTKITYSQPKRMAKKCRDCSSFVSRCYWDSSLGRRIALIGESAASWAYNASAQAKWLNGKKKRVAWKACAVKKLRPGDTIYYETDYAGKDSSQWRYIDHAALYVGNGLILQTGGYGGKGNVGLSSYWPKDKRVKFIGRPCS